MEDHSLRGYLKRQSTEKLDSILQYCLQEENYVNYEFVILEILHILDERGFSAISGVGALSDSNNIAPL